MGGLLPGASVSRARRTLSQILRGSGVDSPDLDARLLLQIALRLDHTGLVRQDAQVLNADDIRRIETLTARRLAGEPIPRIAGVKEFWGLKFTLGPATLVPRPETETVVEAALGWAAACDRQKLPLRIADLGTGSGALLLALLSELPAAWGVGTDLSENAIVIAAANAVRLHCKIRATFAVCNFGRALGGEFDLIVSNPPYIASSAIVSLAREVREHDPLLALDGGEDGLAAYREIARDVQHLLRPGGVFIVELGAGQAEAVADIFRAEQLIIDAPPRLDLGGVPRALLARRA